MNEKHRFDSLITCRIVAVGEIDPDITFCGFETGFREIEMINTHRKRVRRPAPMKRSKLKPKSAPKRVLRLPDLDHTKLSVLKHSGFAPIATGVWHCDRWYLLEDGYDQQITGILAIDASWTITDRAALR